MTASSSSISTIPGITLELLTQTIKIPQIKLVIMHLGHNGRFYCPRVLYHCRGEFQTRGRCARGSGIPRDSDTKPKYGVPLVSQIWDFALNLH